MGQFGAGSPSAGVVGVLEGTYCGCLTAVTALEKGPEAAARLLLGYCLVTAFQTREKQGLSWSKAIVSGVTIRLSTLRVVTPSHYVSQVQFLSGGLIASGCQDFLHSIVRYSTWVNLECHLV